MVSGKQQYNEFKLMLEKKAQELKNSLADFTFNNPQAKNDYISTMPDYGDCEDDNAREVSEYIDRKAVEGTLEKELQDIEDALKRMAAGIYGVCKYCGKKIDEDRLKIRPTSSACVECKKKFKGEV
ncbi:MAG TPA: TraR/DksA C4-type zinc finger protein [bacterium]|nr:TraR/DksA C4-type zinc finger protein [bacterium]